MLGSLSERMSGVFDKLARRRELTDNDAVAPVPEVRPTDFIDVKQLISSSDLRQHARLADEYFAHFDPTSPQLRKPFMHSEALHLIPKLGAILNMIDFYPGMRILDFGAGTGWLSQSLALMGCQVTCVDISATALRLGEEYTKTKHPEIANLIDYKLFDGTTLDISSQSIDRVICFDSFHHVANQEQILSEFCRVLDVVGFAAFCEPGPQHSKTPQSQFEMRTYGVIENDIIIEEIWQIAQSVGFCDIELFIVGQKPVGCTLPEFHSLDSWETAEELTRRYFNNQIKPLYENDRIFTLKKNKPHSDSRRIEGLKVSLTGNMEDLGEHCRITGAANNIGTAYWRPSGHDVGAVNVAVVFKRSCGSWVWDSQRICFLVEPAAPGEAQPFSIDLAKSEIGDAEVYLDLVAEGVGWFSDRSIPKLVRIR